MTAPLVRQGEARTAFFAQVLFRVKTFVDDDAPLVEEHRSQDVRTLAQVEAGAALTGNTLRVGGLAPGRRACEQGMGVLDGESAEQEALVAREIGLRVDGAAVVPHDQIARPPRMFVNEVWITLMHEQEFQQLVALARRSPRSSAR